MCIEANSGFLWDCELRPGNAGTWEGSVELMASCFVNLPADIRELRVRADAGFGFDPFFEILEDRHAQYAVVARLTQAFKRLLPGELTRPQNRPTLRLLDSPAVRDWAETIPHRLHRLKPLAP